MKRFAHLTRIFCSHKRQKLEQKNLSSKTEEIAKSIKNQISVSPNTEYVLFEDKVLRVKRFLAQNERLGITRVLVGPGTNGRIFYVVYRDEKVFSVLDSDFHPIVFSLEKNNLPAKPSSFFENTVVKDKSVADNSSDLAQPEKEKGSVSRFELEAKRLNSPSVFRK